MFSKFRKISSSLFMNGQVKNYFSKKPSMKQRMRTQAFGDERKGKSKQYGYFYIGLYGLVFACCFAAIPLYRVFCEHVGLVGNYDKKTYQFKDQQVVNLKKYIVKFKGQAEPGIDWEFEPVEKQVVVGTSETAIIFYRLRSREKKAIVGFSTYNIAPEQANLYFSKIQCFCFNQQMINPEEELLLPLFFYLQPELIEDPDVGRIREITVNYQFYQSSNQDLAKFAEEEVRKMEENKRKLNEMRARKKNMSVEDYEDYLQEQHEEERNSIPKIDLSTDQEAVKQN